LLFGPIPKEIKVYYSRAASRIVHEVPPIKKSLRNTGCKNGAKIGQISENGLYNRVPWFFVCVLTIAWPGTSYRFNTTAFSSFLTRQYSFNCQIVHYINLFQGLPRLFPGRIEMIRWQKCQLTAISPTIFIRIEKTRIIPTVSFRYDFSHRPVKLLHRRR
jgi:hypothetical protein